MQLSLADRTYWSPVVAAASARASPPRWWRPGATRCWSAATPTGWPRPPTRSTAQRWPRSVLYEPADVTNEDEVARLVDAATAWHGRLHGVVHCAGGSRDHRPDHPDRLRRVAAHGRPQRQRHHVRAQARRAGDGARRRRIVRRHLVDRGEQHPPLVRRLRRRARRRSTT